MTFTPRLALVSLALFLAACGSEEPAAPSSEPTASETMSESEMMDSESESMGSESEMRAIQLPPDGQPGSLSAMAEQPAAEAASSNPVLTTLSTAVKTAGLADTLNGAGPFTIFAPVDDAFAAVPQDTLDMLLADTEALADVLTYHVVQGQALGADQLATMNSVNVANGGTLTLMASGESLELNAGQATIVMPNIQVANGIVHLVDGVLMAEQ